MVDIVNDQEKQIAKPAPEQDKFHSSAALLADVMDSRKTAPEKQSSDNKGAGTAEPKYERNTVASGLPNLYIDFSQQIASGNNANFRHLDNLLNSAKASDSVSAAAPAAAPQERLSQLSQDEFTTYSKQVLAKLDTNHTGVVTKDQLAAALEDPSIKGREAQALAALYYNFSDLHNLSGHEGLLSSRSISAGDIDKFVEKDNKQNDLARDAQIMKDWAPANLSRFDKGGSINRSEIEAALKDPNTSATDRKALEVIQKHYSDLGHMWESGVTATAINNFADAAGKTSDAKLQNNVYGLCYSVSGGQNPETSHDLYADKTNPLNSITPDGVKQGFIGDCYFEASLAAVANAHPEMIKDAIKANPDGTYTVTFPGDKDNPITVKAPTEAEQGLYNHASSQGLWASVMEKAYGQWCEQHFWRRGVTNVGGGYHDQEGADGGGRPEGAMKLLMGGDVSTNTTTFSFQSTIAAKLEAAFSGNSHKAVTAGIYGSIPLVRGEETGDNFYRGHEYTITGFKPDGHGGGTVTIRNPWGEGNDTTKGTKSIPLEEFMKNFSDVCIEQ